MRGDAQRGVGGGGSISEKSEQLGVCRMPNQQLAPTWPRNFPASKSNIPWAEGPGVRFRGALATDSTPLLSLGDGPSALAVRSATWNMESVPASMTSPAFCEALCYHATRTQTIPLVRLRSNDQQPSVESVMNKSQTRRSARSASPSPLRLENMIG